jgi:DNA excision repair protein ERCC-2
MKIMNKILENKLIFIETKNDVEMKLALMNYKKSCDCGRGAIFFALADGKIAKQKI